MVTLAIDIGGSGARALAAQDARDGTGTDVRELRWGAPRSADEPGQVAELARSVLGGRVPDAVAVAFPGTLDAAGVVRRWPNRPWWTGVALAGRLDFGPPTLVDDDAYLAALAEVEARPEAHQDGLFYLGLGTGVGGAWAPPGAGPGHPAPGAGRGQPGGGLVRCEPGHLIVRPDGPRCVCGRRGCLQAHLRTADAAWALALAVADLAEICAFGRLVVGGGLADPALLRDLADHLPLLARPGTDLPRPEPAAHGARSSLRGALLAARARPRSHHL
ncbi:ROK family protein [Streptomyces sp. NPDC048664]|uniref:ROK family protein n=1 Tax=Streptomyces sp. NPDC048664 TaxID=3154505 RepID=UPI0034144C1C